MLETENERLEMAFDKNEEDSKELLQYLDMEAKNSTEARVLERASDAQQAEVRRQSDRVWQEQLSAAQTERIIDGVAAGVANNLAPTLMALTMTLSQISQKLR